MKANSSEDQVQRMLSIIYQIPMGLIEADILGSIRQMNARGVQLLMPVFLQHQLPPTNILELLKTIAPDIVNRIQAFTMPNGCILNQEQVSIFLVNGTEQITRHYFFTINKLNDESYVYAFDDITDLYQKEQQLSQAMQDKAVEQSKFEMAAGILHDIGNAVVGFGSYLTKIKRQTEQTDIATLQNLRLFIDRQKLPIGIAIGDAKAAAIGDLLNGIITNQQASITEVKNSITEQLNIISHIQEILNIQRQYVKGQSSERAPVNLRSIINDSIGMLLASFDKKGIEITTDIPVLIPPIKGDRTKLMQVILNLLKNAVESVSIPAVTNKTVHLTLVAQDRAIEINITDTGLGFEGGDGERFFEKGRSSKAAGTGLGLANCKSIIESHEGTIHLFSNGPGLGATASIHFKI